MINDLEEYIRQYLLRELPVKNGEVNIEFEQPRREWSSRLSKPTLNLFLYDLRENNLLRQPEWEVERGRTSANRKRSAARIDLNYMVTAWANEPEDEHRLLSRVLLALLRSREIPVEDLPESLQNQPSPIPLNVGSHDALQNVADIWGVLDNEIRPSIALSMTLAFNPYQPVSGPLVLTRELRFRTADDAARGKPLESTPPESFWLVGGRLVSEKPLRNVKLLLAERGEWVPVSEEGLFSISGLERGEYTLEISIGDEKPSRHALRVPSPAYEFPV